MPPGGFSASTGSPATNRAATLEFEENSPINPTVYDTALEVWFTHVCYGPPLPDVEAALYEALPDPEVGVSPRGGIRGYNRDGHLDLVPAELRTFGPDPELTIGFPVTDPGSGVSYQVSASAWATWFRWATEGSVYESTSPGAGSEAEAAASRSAYETKGVYQIDTSVRRAGHTPTPATPVRPR